MGKEVQQETPNNEQDIKDSLEKDDINSMVELWNGGMVKSYKKKVKW